MKAKSKIFRSFANFLGGCYKMKAKLKIFQSFANLLEVIIK